MNPERAQKAEIDRLRRSLDEMDRQLLTLLNRRMDVAKRIGERKRRKAQLIFDPIREEEVVADLIEQNTGSLSASGIRAIFQEIFSSSRAQQGVLRIGCCGGAASLLAALRRFGASDQYRAVRSTEEGRRLLAEEAIDLLVLPKRRLLDLFLSLPHRPDTQSPFAVCGEIDLPYHLANRSMRRAGFYIVWLAAEPRGLPDCSLTQKAVFLMAGCSPEAIGRWRHRFGGCWQRTCACAGTEWSPEGALLCLWETFDPPPLETLRAGCLEICGDSAWIVHLGAYPVSLAARL
ncbi:MAG: chorismate mutase [Candidatus Methylacidiphilaceae bacterium]